MLKRAASQLGELEVMAEQVVDAIFHVHRNLGPGLLESVYEVCLAYEIQKRGLAVERQVPVPLKYDGQHMELGFRLDLLVEKQIIVEAKCVDALLPVHKAQLITYLKLTGLRLGFLLNFNAALIKDGMQRIVL